jgi:hypothetical protein
LQAARFIYSVSYAPLFEGLFVRVAVYVLLDALCAIGGGKREYFWSRRRPVRQPGISGQCLSCRSRRRSAPSSESSTRRMASAASGMVWLPRWPLRSVAVKPGSAELTLMPLLPRVLCCEHRVGRRSPMPPVGGRLRSRCSCWLLSRVRFSMKSACSFLSRVIFSLKFLAAEAAVHAGNKPDSLCHFLILSFLSHGLRHDPVSQTAVADRTHHRLCIQVVREPEFNPACLVKRLQLIR